MIKKSNAVGAAPVLHHVPVGALAAVAGGDETLTAATRVHLTDDVAAFTGEVGGHRLSF